MSDVMIGTNDFLVQCRAKKILPLLMQIKCDI